MDKTHFRCDGCGKFIAYADIENGDAVRNFIPDTEYSSEQTEYLCKKCNE